MTDNEQENTGPRYPGCSVTLLGTSVHAVSIMMKVRRGLERHLREQGKSSEETEVIVTEFVDEAQSGDYDNVLTTAFRWVDVN